MSFNTGDISVSIEKTRQEIDLSVSVADKPGGAIKCFNSLRMIRGEWTDIDVAKKVEENALLALALALVPLKISAAQNQKAQTVCDVLGNPARYKGGSVVVDSTVVADLHATVLQGSSRA